MHQRALQMFCRGPLCTALVYRFGSLRMFACHDVPLPLGEDAPDEGAHAPTIEIRRKTSKNMTQELL